MTCATGIWSEPQKPGASIDIYRRNLQRAYLRTWTTKLNGTGAAAGSAEIRAIVKGELKALDRQLQTAAAAPGLDENTRRHFVDCREEIKIILDPRVPRPAPAATPVPRCRTRRDSVRAKEEFHVTTSQRSTHGPSRWGAPWRSSSPRRRHDVVRALSHGLAHVRRRLSPRPRIRRPRRTRPIRPPVAAAGARRPRRATALRAGHHPERPDRRRRVQGAPHQAGISDTLYYEIPRNELGKDFLINSQIKRNAAGSGGYGGQQIGTRVVQWVQKGDRVLLLNIDYSLVADPSNSAAGRGEHARDHPHLPGGGLQGRRAVWRSRD